jgi:hypothetical protein
MVKEKEVIGKYKSHLRNIHYEKYVWFEILRNTFEF